MAKRRLVFLSGASTPELILIQYLTFSEKPFVQLGVAEELELAGMELVRADSDHIHVSASVPS